MKSLVSRGYSSGLIKIDDLSVDSSTVAAKKGATKEGILVDSLLFYKYN